MRFFNSFYLPVSYAFALVLLLWSCGNKEEPAPLRKSDKTVINTRPPAFVATDSVKLSAEILEVSLKPIQEGGFILSVNPEPTPDNSTLYKLTDLEKTGPYSFVVKGLAANKRYYYRFYVKEKDQTLYGTVQAFTTTRISITSVHYSNASEEDDFYEGSAGNEIMIEGVNFSKIPSENIVKIGNTEAQVTYSHTLNDLEGTAILTFRIPDNVPPGQHEVTVTRAQQTVAAPQTIRILPGQWKQMKNLDAGTEKFTEAFSVYGKGYVGGYTYKAWMYEYNADADSWRQLSGFQLPHRLITSFALGGKTYLGVGAPNYSQQSYKIQLYAYNPITGEQEQKNKLPADYPNVTWPYSFTGFAANGHGYMGGGSYTINNNWERHYRKDFYRYNPTTDSWTQIADFPGTSTSNAISFVVDGIAYVALPFHDDKILAEVWAYNPLMDNWSRKQDFPGQLKTGMEGFVIGSRGYLIGGTSSRSYYPIPGKRDFWEYNPATDTWREVANFDNGTRQNINCFVIGNKAYAVIHESYDKSSVWEFKPAQ